jgi:hypothetical protein
MQYYAEYETASTSVSSQSAELLLADADWGCSLFAALADTENMLYGRNFDWEFSPAILLFTDPQDGYASVSMVDFAFLSYSEDQARNLLDLPFENLVSLLDAPYLPFDGMNEMGLAIGMAAVPPGNVEPDPNKQNIGSVSIIREMLDHAANVEEAISIMDDFNINFSGGPPIHYLLADRSGNAVLVEYYKGEIRAIKNTKPWHQATNFLRSAYDDLGEGHCWRFDAISQSLTELEGELNPQGAIEILEEVAQLNTQWSIVYSMSTGQVQVAMGRDYNNIYNFQLDIIDK